MKRLSFIFAVIVLASCSMSELGNEKVDHSTGKPVYTASFENPDTRIYVDSDLKTHWTEGDHISIFSTTYNEEYKFDGQTGDTDGSFTPVDDKYHTGSSVPTIYAVYPYSEETTVSSDGTITVSLPSTQNYAVNSYGLGVNTMVAVTESKYSRALFFQNLCGYIVVRLYGEGKVKSITLTGNNEEKIAGQATVAPVYGQAPAVVMSESATTSITLDCGDGVELGKTPKEATSFWFAVPPVTFSKGFTIRVTNTDLWGMEKSTSVDRTVIRNVKNSLSPLEVNFDIPREGNIEFEDANFKAYCIQNFDTDGDGEISYAEAETVTEIYCPWQIKSISSLEGIQYFTALTRLICYGNQIANLDVSNNTELTVLSCGGNQLTSLDISNNTELTMLSCFDNQLTSLDVSKNTALSYLDCNSNQLTALDVSNNTALTHLYCSGNQLTSLDVSKNTALTRLDCGSNQLTSLDISNNTALTNLSCDYNQLVTMDVSNNTALTHLYCSGNQLTTLDVSNNTALTLLWCYANQLTTLDVSNNIELEDLFCSSNRLTTLDISKNTVLIALNCKSNQLTTLDVSNNMALTILKCDDNPYLTEIWLKKGQTITIDFQFDTDVATIYYRGVDDVVAFEDANFKAYCVKNFDTNGDGEISYAEAAVVSRVYCVERSISSLEGIQYFTALNKLYCDGNQLTALDVSKNTALEWLNCQRNQLTTLDVSKNTALAWLDCDGNQLTTLDVSNNTELKELYCSSNKLTTLDVSNNMALTMLYCSSNQLTTMDVSNNAELEEFYCSSNHLTTLDVNNNTELEDLSCDSNSLITLDVSKNTALLGLNCDNNQLTSLDVSKNTAVTYLYCKSNLLLILDVSNNTALTILECEDNPYLTEIWLKTGQTIARFWYDTDIATLYYK